MEFINFVYDKCYRSFHEYPYLSNLMKLNSIFHLRCLLAAKCFYFKNARLKMAIVTYLQWDERNRQNKRKRTKRNVWSTNVCLSTEVCLFSLIHSILLLFVSNDPKRQIKCLNKEKFYEIDWNKLQKKMDQLSSSFLFSEL